jgi:hypothetical protein
VASRAGDGTVAFKVHLSSAVPCPRVPYNASWGMSLYRVQPAQKDVTSLQASDLQHNLFVPCLLAPSFSLLSPDSQEKTDVRSSVPSVHISLSRRPSLSKQPVWLAEQPEFREVGTLFPQLGCKIEGLGPSSLSWTYTSPNWVGEECRPVPELWKLGTEGEG